MGLLCRHFYIMVISAWRRVAVLARGRWNLMKDADVAATRFYVFPTYLFAMERRCCHGEVSVRTIPAELQLFKCMQNHNHSSLLEIGYLRGRVRLQEPLPASCT